MKPYPLLATVLALAPALPARAQAPPAARTATVVDLTGAAGPMLNYASAAAWRLWGLDAAGRFQVGVGGRVSHFFADAYALDVQAGPAAAGVQVLKPNITALNAAFHLRARVAGAVHLGFSLDVAGLSLGAERPKPLVAPTPPGPAEGPVRPVRANLLRGGLPDRGSLNSDLYASVALARGLSLRGGYSHLVTAYESDASRYRRFVNLAALGLSYQLR